MNVILAITGGIAAYKCADIASILVKEGFCVKVVMTENAKRFITPITMATMSKNPIYDDSSEWIPDGIIKHIELAKWADLFVIVPATANTIAKLAKNITDNLLTSIYLALPEDKKVIICPAMNTRMWEKIQDSLKVLTERLNTKLVCPVSGMLACGDVGEGKLAPVKDIIEVIRELYI
jgi:phosphopantothenoylcysteine synthetase/decarboxylase